MQAYPDSVSRAILARFDGATCPMCDSRVWKGQPIAQHALLGRIKWVHAECIPLDLEPQAPTKGWNGTPSQKPKSWRR